MWRSQLASACALIVLSALQPADCRAAANPSPPELQRAAPASDKVFILKFDNRGQVPPEGEGRSAKAGPDLHFAAAILQRRLAGLGVSGQVFISDDDRLVVRVPASVDRQRIVRMLTDRARLTFQLVDDGWSQINQPDEPVPPGDQLVPSADPQCSPECVFALRRTILLTGGMIESAFQSFDDEKQPDVMFRLDERGTRLFGEATRANVGKRFAAVLDGKVLVAPVIQSPIPGGEAMIDGRFTVESASDLAVLLRSGQLPAPLVVVEER